MALTQVLAALQYNRPEHPHALLQKIRPWVTDHAWLDQFMEMMLQALRADAFAAFPFRMVQGRVTHGLVILTAPGADVTLNWIDAASLAQVRESHVMVSASLSLLQVIEPGGLIICEHEVESSAEGQQLVSKPHRRLEAGEILSIDNRCQAISMISADSDAVLLRMTMQLPAVGPQAAFDITTGSQIAHAMSDDAACRMLPLLAIARLAGQKERAAPMLAELSRADDPVLRWAAMREWLVADLPAALPALHQMAHRDPHVALRRSALAAQHMLNHRKVAQCPA
jgi:hypothetical protein